ncbi:hypothetical protein BH24ACI3_BH24ACI3_09730 [soil metagenome]
MDRLTAEFDVRFFKIHKRSSALVGKIGADVLFASPRQPPAGTTGFSFGECIIRSAAAVEQAMGGITTRLWDDPFEWTLSEELATPQKVLNYLDEVETGRVKAFNFIQNDSDLVKEIPAPIEIRTLFAVLLDSLAKAEHFQGRAFSIFQFYTEVRLSRVE